jgi:uncharacterized protein
MADAMTANKRTVEKYMASYNRLDHAEILSCLTDDVEWVMPGAFHVHGKEAFDREIESPCFEGKPAIVVTRMVEENDMVVTEGTVQTTEKGGKKLFLVYCDVFEMQGGKIRRLTSYVMPASP